MKYHGQPSHGKLEIKPIKYCFTHTASRSTTWHWQLLRASRSRAAMGHAR